MVTQSLVPMEAIIGDAGICVGGKWGIVVMVDPIVLDVRVWIGLLDIIIVGPRDLLRGKMVGLRVQHLLLHLRPQAVASLRLLVIVCVWGLRILVQTRLVEG